MITKLNKLRFVTQKSNEISSLDLKADSDFYFTTTRGGDIQISEAYQKGEGLPLIITDFGTWSKYGGLKLFINESMFERRTLDGIKLTVASIKARPIHLKHLLL